MFELEKVIEPNTSCSPVQYSLENLSDRVVFYRVTSEFYEPQEIEVEAKTNFLSVTKEVQVQILATIKFAPSFSTTELTNLTSCYTADDRPPVSPDSQFWYKAKWVRSATNCEGGMLGPHYFCIEGSSIKTLWETRVSSVGQAEPPGLLKPVLPILSNDALGEIRLPPVLVDSSVKMLDCEDRECRRHPEFLRRFEFKFLFWFAGGLPKWDYLPSKTQTQIQQVNKLLSEKGLTKPEQRCPNVDFFEEEEFPEQFQVRYENNNTLFISLYAFLVRDDDYGCGLDLSFSWDSKLSSEKILWKCNVALRSDKHLMPPDRNSLVCFREIP